MCTFMLLPMYISWSLALPGFVRCVSFSVSVFFPVDCLLFLSFETPYLHPHLHLFIFSCVLFSAALLLCRFFFFFCLPLCYISNMFTLSSLSYEITEHSLRSTPEQERPVCGTKHGIHSHWYVDSVTRRGLPTQLFEAARKEDIGTIKAMKVLTVVDRLEDERVALACWVGWHQLRRQRKTKYVNPRCRMS